MHRCDCINDFPDLRSVGQEKQLKNKSAIQDIFIYFDGTSHLYCMYISIKLELDSVDIDAIKASVPKFKFSRCNV